MISKNTFPNSYLSQNNPRQSQPERRVITVLECIVAYYWMYLNVENLLVWDKEKANLANVYCNIVLGYFFLKYLLSYFCNSTLIYRTSFKQSRPVFTQEYKSYLIRLSGLCLFLLFCTFSLYHNPKVAYLLSLSLMTGLCVILLIKSLLFHHYLKLTTRFDSWGARVDKFSIPPTMAQKAALISGVAFTYLGMSAQSDDFITNFILANFGITLWAWSGLKFHSQLNYIKQISQNPFNFFQFDKLVIGLISLFLTVVAYSQLNGLSGFNGTEYPLTITAIFFSSISLCLFIYLIFAGIGNMVHLPKLSETTIKQKFKWLYKVLTKNTYPLKKAEDELEIRTFFCIHYFCIYLFLGIFLKVTLLNIEEISKKYIETLAYEFDLNDKVHCGELIQVCNNVMKDHKYMYLAPTNTTFAAIDKDHNILFYGQCTLDQPRGSITSLTNKLSVTQKDCLNVLNDAFELQVIKKR